MLRTTQNIDCIHEDRRIGPIWRLRIKKVQFTLYGSYLLVELYFPRIKAKRGKTETQQKTHQIKRVYP